MRKYVVVFVIVCLVCCLSWSCSSSKKSSSTAETTGAPVADFTGAPLSGDAPLTVNFSNSSTGSITSYSWSFGDGGTSAAENPSYEYDADGLYNVSLTVVGPGGSNTKTRTGYIAVGDIPGPDVDFSADPLSGSAPLLVAFTDLTSGTSLSAWSWEFGDSGTSDEQNPEHTYADAGTYSVTLTVTDANGTKAESKTDYITVTGGSASTGVDPSGGSGGTITAGTTGSWDCGTGYDSTTVGVYIPTSYNPSVLASPVVWLFNEQISDWKAVADANAVIIVDLEEYNDTTAYVNKINFAAAKLEAEYNVDKARYHLAGWSAGGNIVVMLGSANQEFCASTMVFPGTGGQDAYNSLAAWGGHKIRLYYACGDEDANYGYGPPVENEANTFSSLGYTTRFDLVVGSGHYISEVTYHKRQDAWNWVKDFNLQN